MRDAILTAQPILVELVQYPREFDGISGDRLAALISEIASAMYAPAPSPYGHPPSLATLLSELRSHLDAAAANAVRAYDIPAGARAAVIQIGATALALAAAWDGVLDGISKPGQPPDTGAEVLRWLRQTIGELMGRTGEAAIATINPRAHLSRLLPENGIASVELAIASRWGAAIIVGSGDTVAAIAAAIVTALHRQSQAAQEARHAQG